jgi:hypothetical protein
MPRCRRFMFHLLRPKNFSINYYCLKIKTNFLQNLKLSPVNHFESNFSANRIIPSSYLFWAERGWWITCNYPTVLKEKNIEKQKEYNLRYLLAKVCTT